MMVVELQKWAQCRGLQEGDNEGSGLRGHMELQGALQQQIQELEACTGMTRHEQPLLFIFDWKDLAQEVCIQSDRLLILLALPRLGFLHFSCAPCQHNEVGRSWKCCWPALPVA